MPAHRLAVCSFPAPFDGEAAYFELELHRLTHPCPEGWEAVELTLHERGNDRQARSILASRPAAVLLHVYRDRVRDALELANALAASQPDIPLLWCGWTAHAPYVQAVSQATVALSRPSLILACGEVEAAVPALLSMIAQRQSASSIAQTSPHAMWFDPSTQRWVGQGSFAQVLDLTSLPGVWQGPSPMRVGPGGAGWIEVARGCKYACGFCVACSSGAGSARPHRPADIQAEIAAAARQGVTLFGLLASAINYDINALRAVAGAIGSLPSGSRRVAGTVHAKFAHPEALELMAQLRWETMIVGLQSTTAEAQRLMQRREHKDVFAAAIERLRALCVPEVELILGLPGDSARGFEQSVQFALSLPVSVSIYRLRLDPWSRFLQEREALGLSADFARWGRVTATAEMPQDELDGAEAWIRQIARSPWTHRAMRLSLDGVPLYSADQRYQQR